MLKQESTLNEGRTHHKTNHGVFMYILCIHITFLVTSTSILALFAACQCQPDFFKHRRFDSCRTCQSNVNGDLPTTCHKRHDSDDHVLFDCSMYPSPASQGAGVRVLLSVTNSISCISGQRSDWAWGVGLHRHSPRIRQPGTPSRLRTIARN